MELTYVSPEKLQQIFNDGGYWQKVKDRKLFAKIEKRNHPTTPKAPVPFCTYSVIKVYIDNLNTKLPKCTNICSGTAR